MKKINFPEYFSSDECLRDLDFANGNISREVVVSREPKSSGVENDVYSIQRLISFLSSTESLIVEWDAAVWKKFVTSPALHPLLSILIFSPVCLHRMPHEEISQNEVLRVQKVLTESLFKPDWFTDAFILLNADHKPRRLHPSIYTSSQKAKLKPRESLESLIYQFLYAQSMTGLGYTIEPSRLEPISAIVYELFENTHDHAQTDEQTLISKDRSFSLRGIVFRRIGLAEKSISSSSAGFLESIEISFFDSGYGMFQSYTGMPLTEDVAITTEWDVMHSCLKKHSTKTMYRDTRPAYRGFGLYEVLRTVFLSQGTFEIRSGRVHGYRDFGKNSFRLLIEDGDDENRPNLPKEKLLDFTKKFVSIPSKNALVKGTAVKVSIPLARTNK